MFLLYWRFLRLRPASIFLRTCSFARSCKTRSIQLAHSSWEGRGRVLASCGINPKTIGVGKWSSGLTIQFTMETAKPIRFWSLLFYGLCLHGPFGLLNVVKCDISYPSRLRLAFQLVLRLEEIQILQKLPSFWLKNTQIPYLRQDNPQDSYKPGTTYVGSFFKLLLSRGFEEMPWRRNVLLCRQ